MTTGPSGCCDDGGDVLRTDLGDAAVELAAAGFAALWRGSASDPGRLLPDRPAVAAQTARDLAGLGRAELDDEGRLVGIHGLTLARTRHSFEHDGRVHHTWCAFDSVGIPAALGLDATARSDCPTCGRRLVVKIRGGHVEVGEAILWLPAPDTTAHLMNDFCSAADLYCSTGHLDKRIDVEGAAGRAVTLAEAAALGARTWIDVAGRDLTATDTDRHG